MIVSSGHLLAMLPQNLWVVGEAMSQRFCLRSLEHRFIDDPEVSMGCTIKSWMSEGKHSSTEYNTLL